MIDRRLFVAGVSTAILSPFFAMAQGAALTATQAYNGLQAGSLILIDVRRPDEWLETGVAPGAWLLDMQDENFVAYVTAVLDRNPDRDVAIICRTGNRTGRLMQFFAENEMTRIQDVSEGMVGGPRGTGWIKSGLPVEDARTVYDAMPKDLTAP